MSETTPPRGQFIIRRFMASLPLQAKGLIALVATVAYFLGVVAVMSHERSSLLALAGTLEETSRLESQTGELAHLIDHSEFRMRLAFESTEGEPGYGADVARAVDYIVAKLRSLPVTLPDSGPLLTQVERDNAALRAAPSRAMLARLSESQEKLEDYVTALGVSLRHKRQATWQAYGDLHAHLTWIAMSLIGIWALTAGLIIERFFGTLAADIRAVEIRAAEIVAGYGGPPLAMRREDEVGRLADTVNRMQVELREREQKLQIAREQRVHHEKMAAVGWLAAAVAHEINNPITAISGIAHNMIELSGAGDNPENPEHFGGPRMILQQTERISAISHQIAEFTRPRIAEPELLDLNDLVRRTATFIGYDRRLRGVELTLDLDPCLPAIMAVADHMTQVLMNLLINSADALQDVAGRSPMIRVTSRPKGSDVMLTVDDNGHGMSAEVQARAFEEMFSTKAADRGRGLGLFMCRTLVQRGGGDIYLASAPGRGTTVRVRLPLEPAVGT